jgi:hypothetical protein
MIFETKISDKKWLEKEYKKSMKELDKFWGLGWTKNTPQVFLLKDRKTIDNYLRKKTNNWVTGFLNNKMDVFLLSPENYEKDSIHKYSNKEYISLLKHELSHCFFTIISKGQNRVIWLDEGIAIYLSGQTNFKFKKPKKLKHFLKSFHTHEDKVYNESGFVIELLVKEYGKEKVIELVRKLKKGKTKEQFNLLFKEIYGFELNYRNINKKLK